MYSSGKDKVDIASKEYEYSPYGSTFKLSHDVAPAGAALGSGGCKDCHHKDAQFFKRPYMLKPFDATGKTVTTPAYKMLNYREEDIDGLLEEK